jgi:hypothetical protein
MTYTSTHAECAVTTSIRRTLIASLVAATFLVGCGGDDAGPSPSDHPAGLLTAGDFDVEEFGSESSNLMFALQEAGFPLDTTSAMDSTHMAALIAGKDILFLPEVTPAFDAATQGLLVAFVDAGGTIVMVGGYRHLTWVNTAFGWSLATAGGFSERFPMPKTAEAHGTPFADGPASIPGNNGGSVLDVGLLPDSAIAVYLGQQGDTNAAVVILPYGDGRLVYFGWDWYDGKPFGIQDGGWFTLLKETAGF